jgi:hypothetical protein
VQFLTKELIEIASARTTAGVLRRSRM